MKSGIPSVPSRSAWLVKRAPYHTANVNHDVLAHANAALHLPQFKLRLGALGQVVHDCLRL